MIRDCAGLDVAVETTARAVQHPHLSHQLGTTNKLRSRSACTLAHIGHSVQCPPIEPKITIPSRCSVPLVPCTAFSRKVSSHDEQTLLGQTDPWCKDRAKTRATWTSLFQPVYISIIVFDIIVAVAIPCMTASLQPTRHTIWCNMLGNKQLRGLVFFHLLVELCSENVYVRPGLRAAVAHTPRLVRDMHG
jgi:hypothetical protein